MAWIAISRKNAPAIATRAYRRDCVGCRNISVTLPVNSPAGMLSIRTMRDIARRLLSTRSPGHLVDPGDFHVVKSRILHQPDHFGPCPVMCDPRQHLIEHD